MSIPVLTIDGPSGAGKGTVSRAVANKLGWHYLDSGAIYRALAVCLENAGTDLADQAAVIAAARTLQLEFRCDQEFRVILDSQDITARLPTEATGKKASIVAAIPAVREVLLQKQRDFKQPPGLVADGRDMGTVVFPDAPYKVFLTASAEERAKRRYKQLIEKGINANIVQITEEIEARDRRDQERDTAPLKKADDACLLDSSDLTIEQVVAYVLNRVG